MTDNNPVIKDDKPQPEQDNKPDKGNIKDNVVNSVKALWVKSGIIGKTLMVVGGLVLAVLLLKLFFSVFSGIISTLFVILIFGLILWFALGVNHIKPHNSTRTEGWRRVPKDYLSNGEFMGHAQRVFIGDDGVAWWNPDPDARGMTMDQFLSLNYGKH